MQRPQRIPSGDLSVDRAMSPLRDKLDEIVAVPLMDALVIGGVQLANATTYHLKHGLGRRVRGWWICDLVGPASTGRIERVVGGDLSIEVQLMATGWGATITVSVVVF